MKRDPEEKLNWLEWLKLQESRKNKPPSKAMPSKYYGNPGNIVEFESAKRKKRKGRK